MRKIDARPGWVEVGIKASKNGATGNIQVKDFNPELHIELDPVEKLEEPEAEEIPSESVASVVGNDLGAFTDDESVEVEDDDDEY